MSELRKLVADELAAPVDPRVSALATAIAAKHGAASRAVLFYGSCLREKRLDGLMLDFYLIVSDYRAAYAKRWLAEHARAWDLAIVDLFLKQGSGLGVIEACRSRDAGQRVVVLSNYATADMRQRCIELGADAVFDKSNEIDALVEYCIAASDASQPGP